MNTLRTVTLLTAVFVLSLAGQAASQGQSAQPIDQLMSPSELDSTRFQSCPHCYRVVLPLGLYIREVTDGGSFVTLEDGSVWEIRLPQRPVASSWQPGDFVQLKTIWAPVDRYEVLLAHGDRDEAEARIAGRLGAGGAVGDRPQE